MFRMAGGHGGPPLQLPLRRPKAIPLFGFADFLDHAKRWPEASRLLRDVVARSNSRNFLRSARNLFDDHDEVAGEVAALSD